jgi:dihydrodipicolinate synthase/N-acetylneuraminate lyase
MTAPEIASLRSHLAAGQVIPAMPLALNDDRSWSERYQRALVRYYLDAGAGGLAVGVHTTQFEVRDPQHDLLETVLTCCANEVMHYRNESSPFALISGICGATPQAIREAQLARSLGYGAGLLSLSAMSDTGDATLIAHCREVAEIIPLIGFYLQPSIGGRTYGYRFWREFVTIPNVVAIKIAPFNRYATLEVVRAVAESGRHDIALYTGNDDNIIHDLLTPFPWSDPPLRIVGGLLGQWAVGTRRAVSLLEEIRSGKRSASEWAALNASLTDFNSAIFDAANGFAGCIAGINEVLRREGLLPSRKCLGNHEVLSPGQIEELDRVFLTYPEWHDSCFIEAHLDRWLT